MLTPQEKFALRLAAEAATPGPWRNCGKDRGGCSCGAVWCTDCDELVAEAWCGDDMVPAPAVPASVNAAYIAAAKPATTLALLDEIAAMQKQIDAQKRLIADLEESDRTLNV